MLILASAKSLLNQRKSKQWKQNVKIPTMVDLEKIAHLQIPIEHNTIALSSYFLLSTTGHPNEFHSGKDSYTSNTILKKFAACLPLPFRILCIYCPQILSFSWSPSLICCHHPGFVSLCRYLTPFQLWLTKWDFLLSLPYLPKLQILWIQYLQFSKTLPPYLLH